MNLFTKKNTTFVSLYSDDCAELDALGNKLQGIQESLAPNVIFHLKPLSDFSLASFSTIAGFVQHLRQLEKNVSIKTDQEGMQLLAFLDLATFLQATEDTSE